MKSWTAILGCAGVGVLAVALVLWLTPRAYTLAELRSAFGEPVVSVTHWSVVRDGSSKAWFGRHALELVDCRLTEGSVLDPARWYVFVEGDTNRERLLQWMRSTLSAPRDGGSTFISRKDLPLTCVKVDPRGDITEQRTMQQWRIKVK
ncbi:MAG: hypothetical protein IT436_02595 [Phycisphaerales bacterium]|nr:hypothetical protein [Phycisphaerales bacterium]